MDLQQTIFKVAFWIGLVSACLSIFSFATGIASIPTQTSVVQAMGHASPTTSTAQNTTGLRSSAEPTDAATAESAFQRFSRLSIRILKFVLIFGSPLLPAATFWKIADNHHWDYEFPKLSRTILLAFYLLPAVVLYTSFFPASRFGGFVFDVLNYLES